MFRNVVRVVALLLVGLHALGLFALGAQIPPDDLIFGNLGQLLVMAALCLVGLGALAWFAPTLGGTLLVVVGGVGVAAGATATLAAALVFGAPTFLAGLLFVGTRPESSR